MQGQEIEHHFLTHVRLGHLKPVIRAVPDIQTYDPRSILGDPAEWFVSAQIAELGFEVEKGREAKVDFNYHRSEVFYNGAIFWLNRTERGHNTGVHIFLPYEEEHHVRRDTSLSLHHFRVIECRKLPVRK